MYSYSSHSVSWSILKFLQSCHVNHEVLPPVIPISSKRSLPVISIFPCLSVWIHAAWCFVIINDREQLPYPILCSFVKSIANWFGLFLPVCIAGRVCVSGEINGCISASSSVEWSDGAEADDSSSALSVHQQPKG